MSSIITSLRKLTTKSTNTSATPTAPLTHVPLVINMGTYQPTAATAQLLASIGGPHALVRMCERFYSTYLFHDPHTRVFVADQHEPHAIRLAYWIAEKMDSNNQLWTKDRAERAKCPVMKMVGKGVTAHQHVVKDRSSAHHAAWFSPHRPEHDQGRRFTLLDSRIWMRLMFLSARQSGLFDHAAFATWYVGFIGHFIAVYERSAPRYAPIDAAWSADPVNVQAYLENGRQMHLLLQTQATQAVNTFSSASLGNPNTSSTANTSSVSTSPATDIHRLSFSSDDDDNEVDAANTHV